MEMSIKQRIASGALALTLLGGTGAGVAAQRQAGDVIQRGGAAGLVAAVVQVNDTVDVAIVDSLNNLRALNNILNNSPILSQNDIDINDINVITGNDIDVNVLNLVLEVGDVNVTVRDILLANGLTFEDIVAVVQVLGGTVVVV